MITVIGLVIIVMYTNTAISAEDAQFFHGMSFPSISQQWFPGPLFQPRASLAVPSWGPEEGRFPEPTIPSPCVALHSVVLEGCFRVLGCPFPLMQKGSRVRKPA